jgi:LPPG:FO 2-phospho-L-lactate transferase
VRVEDRWWDFQEFMIVRRGAGPVQEVRFDGAPDAAAPPEVLEAITAARAVIVGPRSSRSPVSATRCSRQALRWWACHRSSAAAW